MKILGNPWIVGGLVLVAVAVAGRQFLPHLRRAPANVEPASPPAAASPAAEPPPASKPAPAPEKMMDRDYIETHFAGWMDAPHRDPFLFFNVNSGKTESPLRDLKLKAIWRQTEGAMAVINKGIYKEGDTVEGYTVKTINDDEVWLQGSEGKVRLGFAGDEPPAAAHAELSPAPDSHP